MKWRGFSWPVLVWFVLHGAVLLPLLGWWRPLAWAARGLADGIERGGRAWSRGVTALSAAIMGAWPLRLIQGRIRREIDAEEARRADRALRRRRDSMRQTGRRGAA